MKLEASEVLSAIIEVSKGFIPGALGAAVSVSLDKTGSFLQKLLQFGAGIVTSYYVAAGVIELTDFGPMVQQSISFTMGLVAYKSAKNFVEAAAEVAGDIPGELWRNIKAKMGGTSGPRD